jgi:hypothetical protein
MEILWRYVKIDSAFIHELPVKICYAAVTGFRRSDS